jgi:putative mRNA 3-end processing factor
MVDINIYGNGTIILGDKITVDGFKDDYPIRVQSHIHKDHMDNFNSSKGYQDCIIMSKPTKDLLISEFNADLPYRTNLIALELDTPFDYEDVSIRLLDSAHMLGSVQVSVVLPNGKKCGYSGDFNWPLEKVIQVDELAIDSTYGSPSSIRQYDQNQAEEALLEILSEKLKHGSVFLKAHRGTLERTLNCINGIFKYPIIVSSRQKQKLDIYQQYGYNLTEVYLENDNTAIAAIKDGRFIRIGSYYEETPIGCASIILSAYFSRMSHPFVQYSDNAYAVSLSNHADFEGTLEYIKATEANFVITDNTRGGKGVELALAIRKELGISAISSTFSISRDWGK